MGSAPGTGDLFSNEPEGNRDSASALLAEIVDRIKNETAKEEKSWDDGLYYVEVGDILPVHSLGAIEYPFFSLKKLEMENFSCDYGNGVSITISRNADMLIKKKDADGNRVEQLIDLGRATVNDEKLWVYLISKLQSNFKKTGVLNTRLVFSARDYLINMIGKTGGSQFEQLEKSLRRLKGTTITCNIESERSGNGGKLVVNTEKVQQFNLLSEFKYIKETTANGKTSWTRMEVEVTLPTWLVKSIKNMALLQINPKYITGDLSNFEKRIYLLCAKFCGSQNFWQIGLENLKNRLGSTVSCRHFKSELKKVILRQSIPDYRITLSDNEKNLQVFPSKKGYE